MGQAVEVAAVDVPAVDVVDLVVRFGQTVAVRGLSLQAEAGRITALLGPNGAGKTTSIETLEGYRSPSGGRVRVLGLDPIADRRAVRSRVGVMLQSGGVYPTMGPATALRLFASYYEDPLDASSLLDAVGLADVARTPWRRLSGGEQQRLSLALALVGRPEVAFLDEPTAGVDPAGRLVIRELIRDLRRQGVAVLLTTHDLEEAARLADHVVIIDRGAVVASGTPAELMAAGGGAEVRFGAPIGLDTASLGVRLGAAVAEERPGEYRVDGPGTPDLVAALTAWLAERDVPLGDLRAGRQSLEDVFLRLTKQDRGEAENMTGAPGGRVPRGRPLVPEEPVSATPARRARRPWVAQARAEVGMTLRRGESLLLTVGIPVVLLVFFVGIGYPDRGVTGGVAPVDFLAPGILALAVMSTAMVSLAIATGFERSYGVLKRLAATPLGRPALLGAKTAAIAVVEVLQIVVVWVSAVLLGWQPRGDVITFLVVVALGTAGFAGIGLLMAGTLRAEVTLAAANGLYVVLLLLGGMVVPLSRLPGPVQGVARALPAANLADALHATLGLGNAVPGRAWLVLAAWALVAPAAAAATFRWE